jgi:putative AlgH/UPF0301 family transcriptional regulator
MTAEGATPPLLRGQGAAPAWCPLSSDPGGAPSGSALEVNPAGEAPTHAVLSGGPCYEDQPLAVMVIDDPRTSTRATTRDGRALSALLHAPSLLPVRLPDGTTLLIGEVSTVDAAAAVAAAAGLVPRASRLVVGVAVWSVEQLLSELDLGHWGLCQASGSDLERDETELWRSCWETRQPMTAEAAAAQSVTLW